MKRDLLSVKTQQVPFVYGLGMKSQSEGWGYGISGSMRGELNQVSLRSLILASIRFAIWGTGGYVGLPPKPA